MTSSATTTAAALSLDNVRRTTLDNGLTVLTREAHTSPTVASMIWYRVGSRNETPGRTGCSHFLEHMLFKGAARYGKGEVDLLTMKNGGNNNAFTSYDFTAYYFTFAADRWPLALDIEADRMIHTLLDPAEFEAERNVVIEELKAGLDQPWGALMQRVNAVAFERHPYRNPVIGWLEDLEASSRATLEAHYRRYYQPQNATLVLVGDFDADEALARVRRAFESIPGGNAAADEIPPEPAQQGERRFELPWASEVPRFALAFHTPPVGHPDSYPLQVLAVALAEGKASRLYQRLVEGDQATTFISAEYAESKDPTLFYIRGESRGEQPPEAIEAGIYDELARIVRAGLTPRELDRAKHQIEAHFVFSMERALDQAMLLGQIETLDRFEYISQYLPRIGGVTAEQVADVCARYLAADTRTVGWLVEGGASGEAGA